MKIRKILIPFVMLIAVSILMVTGVVGCGNSEENNSNAPKAATNVKIDFQSGAYSFTADEEAAYFFMRVYEKSLAEGSDNIASINPVMSSRIAAKANTTSYSGTLDMTSALTPGADYYAYIFSYASDNVTYSLSDKVEGYWTSKYGTPDITKAIEFDIDTSDATKVTATLTSTFLSDANVAESPEYLISVYENDEATETVTTHTVIASDINEESVSSGWGPPSTKRTATFSLDLDNNADTYFVSIKIVTKNAKAYASSDESSRIQITQKASA